jgi:hypothetical protein
MLISSSMTGKIFMPMLAASSSLKTHAAETALMDVPVCHQIHIGQFGIVEIPVLDGVVFRCR